MSAATTAQLVTDALVMQIWRRGKPDALLHHFDRPPIHLSFPKIISVRIYDASRTRLMW